MIVSGMLLSYVIDFLLKDLPENWAWRLMLGLAAVPAIYFYFLVFISYQNHHVSLLNQDARRVLSYIRTNNDEIDELNQIKQTANEEKMAAKSTS